MDYDKQIERLIKRKEVKAILGTEYKLTVRQQMRLCKLLDVYKTPKNMENMLSTIANFIYYDLSNYVGRYRRLIGTNGTSPYTQMLRYGRYWQDVYKKQNIKKTNHFKNTVRYWINLGYSQELAKEKVRMIQQLRSAESAKKTKGSSLYTVRSIEYWLNIGYTEQEAKERVCKIQTTNGIAFYKEKYPKNYEEKFKERINKWKTSYNNNNLDDINHRKSHSIEGAMARGLDYNQALTVRNKNIEHLRSIRKLPSKISQKFCNMLESKLLGNCYYSDKNYEKLIAGYRVDFYHKETNTVVEFYGDFYHRNPALFESNHIAFGTTAKERWDYDKMRETKIQQDKNVNRLLIVWESEFRQNPEETINNIIKEIL